MMREVLSSKIPSIVGKEFMDYAKMGCQKTGCWPVLDTCARPLDNPFVVGGDSWMSFDFPCLHIYLLRQQL
jgi:hypothetical protein